MLYTKDGFPEVNEIVLCKVKRISGGNTVFLDLLEYEKEGVLTISEIAPGRIRNLRDHVSEGRVIVCKVIRIRGTHIDVSLRRVSVQAKKDKLDEIKKEEFSERVYIEAAKILGTTKDNLFEKTYEPIFEEYETVFEALYDIMQNNEKIEIFSELAKEEKEKLLKIINDRIKPEEVCIKKEFFMKSFDKNGIKVIKNSISEALKKADYDKIYVTYLAAGHYLTTIYHNDMKSLIKIYKEFQQALEEENKKYKLNLEFKDKD